MSAGIEIFADDSRGIYIPQHFAKAHNKDVWNFTDCWPDSLTVITGDVMQEGYWDAWHDVIDNAFCIDENNNKWTLYQDGDLFVICSDLMTEEESKEFFGE